MTNRKFYISIIERNAIDDEMVAKAKALLAQMDKERSASASRAKKKSASENEPLLIAIRELMLDGTPRLTSEIATAIGVSASKASPLAKSLVEEDFLTVAEVKVPKKGIQKQYSLVSEIIEDTRE